MRPIPNFAMKSLRGWTIGLVTIGLMGWLLLPSRPLLANQAAAAGPSPDLPAGKAAYEENCVRCHGPSGKGDGPDARHMVPRPRLLADGVYKFRTTASGTPPTDEDLFQTISTGLPGSQMPSFERLPEETRWQLAYYVKSLSSALEGQTPERLDMGSDPGVKKVDFKRGKELYAQLGCGSCHGNLGRGNGPSAATLTDNWSNPIRPVDLTHGWSYRAGSTPKQIVARVMTGIDGSPMPSYADALSSKEDAWILAYYVHYLQVPPRWSRTVEAVKVSGELPLAPYDHPWQDAPRTDLRLSSIVYQQGEIQPTTVTSVSVQAVYNEEAILFRLTWHDPTEDRATPPDAVCLALEPDRYLKTRLGSLRSWPADPETPALDLCFWSADKDTGRESILKEMDTLNQAMEPGQLLESHSFFEDGEWTLLVKRPFDSQLAGRKKLEPQRPILFGVTVWNGGNGEQGRRRANSNWVDLILK